MANKKTVLQVTLLSGGKALHAITCDEITAPLEIGKAETCTWRPSGDDITMHEHHARLVAKGDLDLRLEPIDGAPLKRKAQPFHGGKLVDGDRIAIGDSELMVRTVAKVIKTGERYHRLEGLNGVHQGRLIPIKGKTFRIGSSPDNDLVIDNDIVAAHQLELSPDEHGVIWAKDLGSRNGSFVNGERLTEKARMIKNADVLGIAIWDYRFLDRSVPHVRSNLGRQMLLAMVTALILVGGYIAVWMRTPDWRVASRQVLKAAQSGDLQRAMELLPKVYEARGANDNIAVINSVLRPAVLRWHRSWRDWEDFKELVRTGRSKNFAGILTLMGRIRPDQADDWSWNPSQTEALMAESGEAEALMSLYFTVSKIVQGHKSTAEEDKSVDERLKKFGIYEKDWATSDKREWIRPLKAALVQAADQLKEYREAIARVNALVGDCGDTSEELATLRRRLQDLERNSSGYLRTFAATVLDPLSELELVASQLATNRLLIINCETEKVNRSIDIPSADDCMVHDRLLEIRRRLVERNARTNLMAMRFGSVLRGFARAVFSPEEQKEFNKLVEIETWRRLFKCDTFEAPPPSRRRKAPISEYDRILGIEWMWGYIKLAPLSYPSEVSYEDVNGPAFEPQLVRGLGFLGVMRSNESLIGSKDFQDFRYGKAKEFSDNIHWRFGRLKKMESFCDQIIKEDPESRAALLAFALKLMIGDETVKTEANFKQLKQMAAKRRQKLDAIEQDEDGELTSERMHHVIRTMLNETVPGDPRLPLYWEYYCQHKDEFKETKKK